MNKKHDREALDDSSSRIDRRSFVKLGAAGLAATQLSSNALSQTPTPTPSPSPTPQKPSPLAEAYVEVVKVRFGDQIQPNQWDQVRRELEGNVRNAERFRAFKLQNGDEPDFVFTA